jgi:hypothetical protein
VGDRESVILIVPSSNLWSGSHQVEERKVHDTFVAELRAAGLQVVDPTKAFEAQGHPLDYYFKNDPHWNPRGHSIAADELMRWFQRYKSKPE